MAVVTVTPVALGDAVIDICGTRFTYADILSQLRRDSSAADDETIFESAYREYCGTWELAPGWQRNVAEDLVLFKLGKSVPPYIVERIAGIMCAGK